MATQATEVEAPDLNETWAKKVQDVLEGMGTVRDAVRAALVNKQSRNLSRVQEDMDQCLDRWELKRKELENLLTPATELLAWDRPTTDPLDVRGLEEFVDMASQWV